jgi:L-proline amide hydrolase
MEMIDGESAYAGMRTAYRIAVTDRTDLERPGIRPLVAIHGGPGCTHDYLLSLVDLVTPDRPVVFYDQIGNGRSTHARDAPPGFWSIDLFLGELDALLDGLGFASGYDILGQSWGGMLAAEHAVRRPAGLRRLVIANSPASMPLWRSAAAQLRAELPDDIRRTLEAHEEAGSIDSDEYRRASDVFYARHVCRLSPLPDEVAATFAWIDDDPTVYHAMNGPTEFHVVGSLRDWTIVDQLGLIEVPTLVINGRHDEATDETIAPFLSRIPDVRHRVFEDSSHMPHWEEREEYMAAVSAFLAH